MRRMFVTVCGLLLAATVSAQEVTVVRYYVVPKVGTGAFHDAFKPKYVTDDELGPGWHLARWSGMDYGFENIELLEADVTAAQHTTLSAQTDVLSVPTPLASQVSAVALPTVQLKLEAMNLPGGWVTTSHTYAQVLHTVIKVIAILQRYAGMFPAERVFSGTGVTLDTRWNQLTAPQQQRLRDVAASFSLDTTGITNTMTIRQILRAIGDQLPDFPIRGS